MKVTFAALSGQHGLLRSWPRQPVPCAIAGWSDEAIIAGRTPGADCRYTRRGPSGMRLNRIAVGAIAVAGVAWLATPAISSASITSTNNSGIPRYQHIVEIMMENTSYSTIIGNPLAPNLNSLANTYGLATNYWGVTHPSEPNYVANIGGSFFGIQDDNQFYCTPAMSAT